MSKARIAVPPGVGDVYWCLTKLKAFCAAQQETFRDLEETAALKTMLPWAMAHLEEARRELGEDFWPYGFEKNRDNLATFLRYSFEQGLSKKQLQPEDLFAPETIESFKI